MSGDLLIAVIALENETGSPQFSSWSDGFIEIKDKTTGGSAGASVGVAYKFSDGTEGANITVDSNDSERAAHFMYRISGHNPSVAPEISAGANGNSTAPNPDSLTPAGGAQDYLWIALCAFEKDDETITGFPTNYGSDQINISMFSGATIGAATRDLNAASEDPGAFTISGAEEWQAFTLAVHPEPEADLSGSVVPTVNELLVIAGGETLIIDLVGDTWVASGAPFDAVRQDIIDGITSAGAESGGWNNEVRDKMPVTDVVRTSGTRVTVTFSAQAGYAITAPETITVTVPASALVTSTSPIVATPTFDANPFPSALVGGTVSPSSPESAIVAGGRTITIVLTDDDWVAAGAPFDAVRQDIIDGLNSAGAELLGWNNEVRDKEVVTAVVRTTDKIVTITLSASPLYDITANEVITVTVPASALAVSTLPVTGAPTFTITFEVLTKGHFRDRHPSGHDESGVDVNEPDVNTADVNTYDVN